MEKKMTLTAAVIIAGGLAVGVGLARPASTPGNHAAPAAIVDSADSVDGGDAAASGYGAGMGGDGAAMVDGGPQAADPAAPGQAVSIVIDDFTFSQGVAATPGQTIVVTNQDTVAHTLTFTSGAIDTGVIEPGASVAITAPATAGTFDFICTIHPSMAGQLTVVGS